LTQIKDLSTIDPENAMPIQPSDKEEEYFARIEMERRRKMEEDRQKAVAESERKHLKELHYMHCPKCGSTLQEVEFKGVRIDKCFGCEGLWLDAGELETLSKLEQASVTKAFKIFGR
jgi:hypothetical protein